jgi:putative sigma-54 modulation protein
MASAGRNSVTVGEMMSPVLVVRSNAWMVEVIKKMISRGVHRVFRGGHDWRADWRYQQFRRTPGAGLSSEAVSKGELTVKTELRSHALTLKPVDQQQIERRLYIALRSFSRHIDVVRISIRDVNGPRGGRDLLGQVIVRLRRGFPIVVRAEDDCVHRLVSQLAAVVRRAVKSRIRRRKARLMRHFRGRRRPLPSGRTADALQSGEPLENRSLQLAS